MKMKKLNKIYDKNIIQRDKMYVTLIDCYNRFTRVKRQNNGDRWPVHQNCVSYFMYVTLYLFICIGQSPPSFGGGGV